MGQPDFSTALEILNYSLTNGLNFFDTASDYGTSESILGSFYNENVDSNLQPVICTKLKPVPQEIANNKQDIISHIKKSIDTSMHNLKLDKIPILMSHRVNDLLLQDRSVYKTLVDLKDNGIIDNIGVSIYGPEDLFILDTCPEIRIIQIPLNIVDQRLLKENLLKNLKQKGYYFIVRSVYLQGLIFYNSDNLPLNLAIAKEVISKIEYLKKEYALTSQELAIGYVKSIENLSSMIIGAESIKQVENNINIFNRINLSKDLLEEIENSFENVPTKIVDPRLWN